MNVDWVGIAIYFGFVAVIGMAVFGVIKYLERHRHKWGKWQPFKVTYTWETKGDMGTKWKQCRDCETCGRRMVRSTAR